MKVTWIAVFAAFTILTLGGCGSDNDNPRPPIFSTSILSNPTIDGDIQEDLLTGLFTVTQGNTQSVFAGLDPVAPLEYRSFLHFPLTGSGGVPGNAIIESASLDIVINSIEPQPLVGTIPLRIDLVSFLPPLIGTDFDRTLQPALATMIVNPPISWADFGQHVTIDVTPLMVEAQRLELLDFQVRILEDLGDVNPGLIEINDTTGGNRSVLAPLLTVSYF